MLETLGRRGDYDWLDVASVPRLVEIILDHHRDARLCVTAFDSGRFKPSREEVAIGWTQVGNIAVSPPLTDTVVIPTAGFDEWYIFDRVPLRAFEPEVFVNYVPFPVKPLSVDANTEPDDGDRWLADAQDRFWRHLAMARPISYVARSDSDIVISRHGAFVEDLRKSLADGSKSDCPCTPVSYS